MELKVNFKSTKVNFNSTTSKIDADFYGKAKHIDVVFNDATRSINEEFSESETEVDPVFRDLQILLQQVGGNGGDYNIIVTYNPDGTQNIAIFDADGGD